MLKNIVGNVYFVEDPHQARNPYCHCLYIDDDQRTLVDTSSGPELVDAVAAKGVDLVLTSHYHEDHIMNLDAFPDAEIRAHELDAPGIRSTDNFLSLCGFSKFNDNGLGQAVINYFGLKDYRVDKEFSGGEVFDLGKTTIQVIHTPGHTPGHCAFYFPQYDILFAGDIDLTPFGPFYGTLASDVDQFINSIQKIRDIAPGLIVSAHRGIIKNNISQNLSNFLNKIFERDEILLSLLQTPQTLEQLAEHYLFFGRPLPPYRIVEFLEKMNVYIHLRRLINHNLVEKEGELYFRS